MLRPKGVLKNQQGTAHEGLGFRQPVRICEQCCSTYWEIWQRKGCERFSYTMQRLVSGGIFCPAAFTWYFEFCGRSWGTLILLLLAHSGASVFIAQNE